MMLLLRRNIKYLAIISISFLCLHCNTGKVNPESLNPDPDNGGISLPEGFRALVVADNLGRGRHIDVNTNGDIYMALRSLNNGNGIVALRDTTGDGRADIVKYFGDYAGTGMEIYNGYLYFGGDTMVLRYKLRPGELIPEEEPELVVSGFPDQNQHRDKPFAIDNDGNIYVNVGAPSNACMEETRTTGSPGMYPCPQLERQAGIWKFRVDELNQTQMEDGQRYASGIRNSIALTWNDVADNLYVVMHGRDQLSQFFPDLYTEQQNAELPAEEFLMVKEGSVFSWPYYYYDQIKDKMVVAPEYGGDGEKTDGPVEVEDPVMAFPGHLAPNDILFYTGSQFPAKYINGAFICFHGSWNRAPLEQEGYFVAFVPFEGELPSGEWEIFADDFAGREVVNSPGQAEHRPMGISMGNDGSLYVCDSQKGKIWRIFYETE
ncbi:MAG: PQQ-dependent sugar dehydrogenase [Bacteroidota bacterium]